VLERGYSLVQHTDGSIVRDSAHLAQAEPLTVTFARGQATVRVEKISD
jgi:exonuclease VII large subunit